MESLHKIISTYVHPSDADDICQDVASWLQRNFRDTETQHYTEYTIRRKLVDSICEVIWKSCDEADHQ